MDDVLFQVLTGVASGAILFMVASGLTLVFGTLRLVNFAHGSLFMIGAFVSGSIASRLDVGENAAFLITLVLAGLATAAVGIGIEVLLLRPIYSRPSLTQLIVTFGIALVVSGVIRGAYGPAPQGRFAPPFLDGGMSIFGRLYPIYALFLIGLAAATALALWVGLYRTDIGRATRAAAGDPELLALSGVNVRWLFTGVFAVGAFLAGLAGAAVSGQGAVLIGIDVEVIVKAFVVIVIGGMGSLPGALVGSLLVGIAEALGVLWIPKSSLVVVFAVLVVVLAVRPQGLFGRKARTDTATRPLSLGLPTSRVLAPFLALARRRTIQARHVEYPVAALALAALAVLPSVASTRMVLLAEAALIFGLFALSLNLLVGTTGLLSFGHALFFGLGAYFLALTVRDHGVSPMVALPLTIVVGVVVGLVTGFVALRGRELYFSLLTLGIAQLGYAVAVGWEDVTNGSDGVVGLFGPTWLLDIDRRYWFVLAVTTAGVLAMACVTGSPFGDALRGIRENRQRAAFSGLGLRRYELAAFVVAGGIASLSGGLFAMTQGQAFPELSYWSYSALPIIMCLLGGVGSFAGPLLGSFFYVFITDALSQSTRYWDVVIGTSVIAVALLMPLGLAGLLSVALSPVARVSEHVAAALHRSRPRTTDNDPSPAAALEKAAVRRGGDDGFVLSVADLTKSFGGLHAVRGVSFDVERGSMHAIIGPNGAGKTTVFNLITGLIQPDAGRILLDGNDITGYGPTGLVRRGVGRSFQQTSLFWDLSVDQNLVLADAGARSLTRRPVGKMPRTVHARARAILDELALGHLVDVPAAELSHGDQRTLELGLTLAVSAHILLLDEPTAGLSPGETSAAVQMIRNVAESTKATVLFIEHDMDVVFNVADRVTVLHEGRVLEEGTPDDVRASGVVQAAYLGEPVVDEAVR